MEMYDGWRRRIITVSWFNSVLNRVEKLPSLDELLRKTEPQQKQMTGEELLAKCQLLNAAYGGRVVKA